MAATAFWVAAATIVYTYLVFPVVLLARGLFRRLPYREEPITPTVGIVIAAHNEASTIQAKLDSIAALDYPPELLDIVVACDGCNDGTEEIVEQAGVRGVRVLSLPRVGKAATLEAAVRGASGEILVFSDANSSFARDAVRKLVQPFADPRVGGVAGDQRYLKRGRASGTGSAEGWYWDIDRLMKRAQSASGSATSATGSIYAIRRSLFSNVASDSTDDFYVSTGVIQQGYRLVFAEDAAAYEPVAASGSREFARKARVMTRGLRGVVRRRALLDPRRHGFYAIQLFSHKVLRRLMVFPQLVIAIVLVSLWRRNTFYRLAAALQAAFYGLAAGGLLLRGRRVARHPLLAFPAYYCLVNAASFVAVLNLVRGRRIERWQPAREMATSDQRPDEEALATALQRLRGDPETKPDASIIIPVNAQGDLENVLRLLADIARYQGRSAFEVVLVINNYAADAPPPEIERYQRFARVVARPNIRRPGEAVAFSARIAGSRDARGDAIISFDADSRIPDASALLDWYVDVLRSGVGAAYTHIEYYGLRPHPSIHVHMFLHHAARWIKRVVLGIPTNMGTSYGVERPLLLQLYDEGYLADELNVGPTVKARARRVAYSGAREHHVVTSGRMFRGGWRKIPRYFIYRLLYNIRVLPVRRGAARRTGRENDPVRRFVGDELVWD